MQLSISIIYPFSLLHSIGYVLQLGGYIWYTKLANSLQLHDGIFQYEMVNFVSFMLFWFLEEGSLRFGVFFRKNKIYRVFQKFLAMKICIVQNLIE
jgi:hypothetical protein